MSRVFPTVSFRCNAPEVKEEFLLFLRSQQFSKSEFYTNLMRCILARFAAGEPYYPCPDGVFRDPRDYFAGLDYNVEVQ